MRLTEDMPPSSDAERVRAVAYDLWGPIPPFPARGDDEVVNCRCCGGARWPASSPGRCAREEGVDDDGVGVEGDGL